MYSLIVKVRWSASVFYKVGALPLSKDATPCRECVGCFFGLVPRTKPLPARKDCPDLCGEAGTRRERRYGGGAGGDLGRLGRESRRLLLVVYKGGEAEDAEAALGTVD